MNPGTLHALDRRVFRFGDAEGDVEFAHHGADDEFSPCSGKALSKRCPKRSCTRWPACRGFTQKGMADLGEPRFAGNAGPRFVLARINAGKGRRLANCGSAGWA